MNIAFLFNDIGYSKVTETTIYLAYTAHQRGHKVFVTEVDGLSYRENGGIAVKAIQVPEKQFKRKSTFVEALLKLKKEEAYQWINHGDMDVLWLRYNPPAETGNRTWAQQAGILFGQVAIENGILVVNDPYTLSYGIHKMYFQMLPEEVRPATVITRDPETILDFRKKHKKIVLKPFFGTQGEDVFKVEKDTDNINQIIETVARKGYIIAQEYLPAITEGDIRLFLINGRPLEVNGTYAALKRVSIAGDFRTNMHAGGTAEKVKLSDECIEMVHKVTPQFVKDGLFMVGLDIVGDKLIEANVISTGGLHTLHKMYDINFCVPYIESLEKKVAYQKSYNGKINNKRLATLE